CHREKSASLIMREQRPAMHSSDYEDAQRPIPSNRQRTEVERLDLLSVHLINPSDNSFGTAVITPRWLFVLAAATPREVGDPILIDESLEPVVPESIHPGDIV